MNEHRRRLLGLLGVMSMSNIAGCELSDSDSETGETTDSETTARTSRGRTDDRGTPDDGNADPDTETSQVNAKLVASDGNSRDKFGSSTAIFDNGTTAVIGAPEDEDPNGFRGGSAYVYQQENGEWSEEWKLTLGDGGEYDAFGSSVRVSGDRMIAIIGAPGDGDPNGLGAGSAYVFQREGREWRRERKLIPGDGDGNDRFGNSLGISGDGTTAVIGAPSDEDPNGEGAGSVYVFQRENGEWRQEQKLTPEEGDSRDFFGNSVGVSDDGMTAVVGAHLDEDPNGSEAGSAFVFQREGEGWRRQRKLTPEGGDSNDRFGNSVDVSGDGITAVIGAFRDEDPNGERAGSAYIFQQESGEWRQERKLTPEDGDSNDRFGNSVGVSGDGTTAVIGADFDEESSGEEEGSVYVFQRKDGEWRQERKRTPEDGRSGDLFGRSVSVSGDGTTAVIGAVGDDNPNGEDVGSAYVFSL